MATVDDRATRFICEPTIDSCASAIVAVVMIAVATRTSTNEKPRCTARLFGAFSPRGQQHDFAGFYQSASRGPHCKLRDRLIRWTIAKSASRVRGACRISYRGDSMKARFWRSFLVLVACGCAISAHPSGPRPSHPEACRRRLEERLTADSEEARASDEKRPVVDRFAGRGHWRRAAVDSRRDEELQPEAAGQLRHVLKSPRRTRITRDVEIRNVMAVLPGHSPRRVYVSGHYDTVRDRAEHRRRTQRARPQPQLVSPTTRTRPTTLRSGVNDDGSGTGLTRENARLQPERHRLRRDARVHVSNRRRARV